MLAVRVDEHGIEQWSYRYDAAGNLEREEYRARGQLEKIVRYLEGGRVEELYRAGLPFLVVTYRGGVKVLEEFLEGGRSCAAGSSARSPTRRAACTPTRTSARAE